MKKLLVVLIVIGLAIVAATMALPLRSSRGENGFGYAALEFGNLTDTVNASGPIQPAAITIVSSPVPGQVAELAPGVDCNTEVKKGALLIKLDDRLAKLKKEHALVALEKALANTDSAHGQLSAAQITLDRQLELEKENIGIKAEKERAQVLLKAAQANVKAALAQEKEAREGLKQAELNLEQTEIRAPESGTILERKVNVGQLVGPPAAMPLLTMTPNLENLEVHAQVAEGDISRIKAGLDASFTVYAYSDVNEKFQGKVKEIRQIPTSVQGAVFYDTLIEVRNRRNARTKEWMLRPGMTATVEITCRKHENVWKMPSSAVTFQLEEAYHTEQAKEKLKKWENRSDREHWKVAWIMDDHHKPWPIFVRTGGVNAAGETGITDGEFAEILEWDPELTTKPDPSRPIQVIIKAPPAKKPGILDKTSLKFS